MNKVCNEVINKQAETIKLKDVKLKSFEDTEKINDVRIKSYELVVTQYDKDLNKAKFKSKVAIGVSIAIVVAEVVIRVIK